jgi:hypothetical protein
MPSRVRRWQHPHAKHSKQPQAQRRACLAPVEIRRDVSGPHRTRAVAASHGPAAKGAHPQGAQR